MHTHVSREEWVFRGLAIAMCLAMMGMAVMPLVYSSGSEIKIKILYIADRTGFSKEHPYLTAFLSNGVGGAVGSAVGVAVGYYLVKGAEWGALAGGLVGAIVGAFAGAAVGVA